MAELVPIVGYSACAWPVDAACWTDEWNDLDTPAQNRALALAITTLRMLTLRRVGGCPVDYAPRAGAKCCFIPYHGMGFNPGLDSYGHWVNNCSGICNHRCGVDLPAPVGEVYSVKVDGVEHLSDFTLYGARLVWTSSSPCPIPGGDPAGSVVVRYMDSYPVDGQGQYAVAALAMEYAKACADRDCRLPSNVTTIVRQGISMELQTGLYPDGLTGLPEVDPFILRYNPFGAKTRPTIYSPDLA